MVVPMIPSAPRCTSCNGFVYIAEKAIGPSGDIYHTTCFRCSDCGTRVLAGKWAESNRLIYCQNCHKKVNAANTISASSSPKKQPLATPDQVSDSQATEEAQPSVPDSPTPAISSSELPYSSLSTNLFSPSRVLYSPAGSDVYSGLSTTQSEAARLIASSIQATPLCVTCGKPAYAAEAITRSEGVYHRECHVCCKCKARITPGMQRESNNQIICVKCHVEASGGRYGVTAGRL